MGNACCGGARPQGVELNDVSRMRHHREQAWAATGTVGLRDAKLKSLPSSVFCVGTAARVLDASNNQLSALPTQVAALSALQRLILSNNKLEALPLEVFSLKHLKWLILDSNELASLPENIQQLTSLERLSACKNSLSTLPDGVGVLQRLKVCHISGNKLSSLPASLGNCSALEELDLSGNYIQAIPDNLGNLQQLKILSLDQNRIAQVPSKLFQGCQKLHTLSLQGNPITMQDLEATDGFTDFERRRQTKYSKQILSGVMSPDLKESVERQRA